MGEGLFDTGELDDGRIGPGVGVAQALGAHDADVQTVGLLVSGADGLEGGPVLDSAVVLAEDADRGAGCGAHGLEDELAPVSALPHRRIGGVVDDDIKGRVVFRAGEPERALVGDDPGARGVDGIGVDEHPGAEGAEALFLLDGSEPSGLGPMFSRRLPPRARVWMRMSSNSWTDL